MDITVERVTEVTPELRALIEKLDGELAAAYDPNQRHGIPIEQLLEPRIRVFLAWADGVAAACGGFVARDGYAEVKRMYTRPSLRGRGLAKALLSRIEAEARDAGLSVLRLETGLRQPEAIGLYERMGFRPRGPFGPYATMPAADIELSVFYEKSLDRA